MKRTDVIKMTVALLLMWSPSAFAHEDQTQASDAASQTQEPLVSTHKEEGITVGGGAHGDHDPKHGGIFSMVGDYHVELVEQHTEFRVYLYDAFSEPVSVTGLSGTLTFEAADLPTEASQKALRLVPSEDDAYLVASKPSDTTPTEVTVALSFRGEELEMTFPLQITLEGRVVDVACFARDGMAALAREHDECARMCLLAGAPVGVLVGEHPNAVLYLVTIGGEGTSSNAANERLLRFVSRKVNVTGKLIQRGQLKILELADVQPVE